MIDTKDDYEFNEEDFIDFEPLLMICGKQTWIHPSIDELANMIPDKDNPERMVSENPVFRMFLKGKNGKETYIVFKSEYFESKDKLILSENEADDFELSIFTCFFDDVWVPGGGQFIFHKMHKKMYDALHKQHADVIDVTRLSSDVKLFSNGIEYSADPI